MNLHPWQGRYFGVALICAALAAFHGCKDDDSSYVSSVVDPGPEPEPDPGPAPGGEPDPNPDTGSTLYRTTDGGATWTTLILPFWLGSGARLKCFDAQNGWLKSGETLYSTVDGGATWQVKLHLGTEHGIFDAVSINMAWAATRHPYSDVSEFLRTTDGGATWTSSALLQNRSVSNLDFIDGSSGWLQALGSVYHTSDGGATWTKLPKMPEMPEGPWTYQSVYKLAFVDSTTGWAAAYAVAVAEIPFSPRVVSGFILKFTTGNNPEGTWEVQLGGENTFGGLLAVDPDHAWALSDDGLFRTQDGGATWSNLGMPSNGIGDFQFTDASNGWMIHDEQLRSTSDGGESWTVRLTLTDRKFRSQSFISATTGWLVARTGL